MSTILFHHIIFGPIISRRLGHSLGVNLLPANGKICTFDCIYCECGWNKDGRNDKTIPTKEMVFQAMDEKFAELEKDGTPVDTITFSGNGEPTLHPDFPEIIDYTLKMRDKYFPKAAVSVLSNASMINKKEVRDALMKITNPILKLDSGLLKYVKLINNPQYEYSIEETVNNLRLFNGDFILQTMFLKGLVNGERVDMTLPEITKPWIDIVLDLRPREVMMYSLDRETPAKHLEKVTVEEMQKIAVPLIENGIKVQIKG